jgi:hypothetical protein
MGIRTLDRVGAIRSVEEFDRVDGVHRLSGRGRGDGGRGGGGQNTGATRESGIRCRGLTRTLLFVVGFVGVFSLALGCSTIRVWTDFDHSASFDDLARYAWLEPPKVENVSPFADNTLLRKRVREAIEQELAARGFQRVETPEEADFITTYSVELSEVIRDDGSVGYGAGGYYGYGGLGVYSSPGIRNYQESTLVIDVLAAESGALLWRGWANGLTDTRDKSRGDKRIERGVKKILDEFPPPPPKSDS